MKCSFFSSKWAQFSGNYKNPARHCPYIGKTESISNNLIILHSQWVRKCLSETKEAPMPVNNMLSCFSYSLLWMRARRQDPSFAILSLQNTAKMANEKCLSKESVVSAVKISFIRQDMEMRLTKTLWHRQIAQLFRNFKFTRCQGFTNCHKHIHFLKCAQL